MTAATASGRRMPSLAQSLRRTRHVRMVPGTVRTAGRRLRFAVSDNDPPGPDGPGSPPIWAVNLHGYLGGGEMYWRESALLAERLGWRVLNPSLPGFGGSDPLGSPTVHLDALAADVHRIVHHVGAGPAVLLGHSMGGAVAIRCASGQPDQCLGILYRNGIATPAWRHRRGLVPAVLAPVAPDLAPLADMGIALALDAPDLLAGSPAATLRALLPDLGRNLRTVARSLPVGTLLMSMDLRPEIRALGARGLPILPEWGCFDRLVPRATAEEFADCADAPVLWVPGGHSWMLSRPRTQADVLVHTPRGQDFVEAVRRRWRRRRHAGRPAPATGRP